MITDRKQRLIEIHQLLSPIREELSKIHLAEEEGFQNLPSAQQDDAAIEEVEAVEDAWEKVCDAMEAIKIAVK